MRILLTALMIAISVITSGCASTPQDASLVVYSGPTVTDNLSDGYKKTTVGKVESFIHNKLQVPTYLPPGYEIREVYYKHEPESSPPVTNVYLLVSEQPVEWNGPQFRTRLVIYIGWDKATLGLKMPWAEFIEEAKGRLEIKEGKYILWKASYGERMDSTVKVYASEAFSRDELIKIAASIPGFEKRKE